MSASREKNRKNRETEGGGKGKLYAALGVVAAVAAAALIVWNSGIVQRNATAVTVGGENYSVGYVQYYYESVKASEAYYAAYGMSAYDATKSPKEQTHDMAGHTYYEKFMEEALNQMQETAVLAQEARANGYALTEEDLQSKESTMTSIKTSTITSGYGSVAAFLKANYGSYVTEKVFEQIVEDNLLAASYAQSCVDAMEYSDDEITAYYTENKDMVDDYTRTFFSFDAKVPTTDADGNEIEMTDEEYAAALETAKSEAKAKAEAVAAALEAGEDPADLDTEYSPSSMGEGAKVAGSTVIKAYYGEWMTDASREAGDITIQENDGASTYTYQVIRFEGRGRDESLTANIRHILIAADQAADASEPSEEQYAVAKERAQTLLEQWKAGDATEESFAALAEEYSADTGSAAKGGMIECVSTADSFVDTFMEWSLDSSRKDGDTGIVQNTGSSIKGWHVMYFAGWDNELWQVNVENTLKNESYTTWIDGLLEAKTLTEGDGIRYI